MQVNSDELKVSEEIFQGWQQTVNLIAELAHIPAALIMRVSHENIQVFATSESDNNPYVRGMTEALGQGLYCETVIAEQSQLLIPNALKHSDWNQNPDIGLGMISYCGLPLNWPNGVAFGTICMLDSEENCYTPQAISLLERFRDTIETDLRIIFEKHSFEQANLQLEARIAERTRELENLTQKLSKEIDRRNASEHTLQYNQQYDALTGLANRSSLLHSLEAQLEQLDQSQSGLAVLYMSLSNFKSINNSYGHVIGDTVLRELARRIQSNLEHHQFAARIIGDEFVIISQPQKPEQTTCQDFKEQTLALAQTLSKLSQHAYSIHGHSITVIANIGIAMAPDDGMEAQVLIQKAGAAMAASKEQELSYGFFSEATEALINQRYLLETHLAEALENDELVLHYQPLICTKTGVTVGAEALLRWFSPVLGNVRPDQFIHVAEQTGQIIQIGNFVLRSAISQASRWHTLYPAEFRIAVNISPMQFKDDQFARYIAELLNCYGLPPHYLEIEITEGVLIEDEHRAIKTIRMIQELGVRTSLDDFGTGYSSLSYLKKYSFDTLKIDRSFIANIVENKQDQKLARGIISIARSLDLQVVAEGIETAEQDRFISQEGCDYGQGYFYGKPVPGDVFAIRYLKDNHTSQKAMNICAVQKSLANNKAAG
mgnify:CR=1 FL=1